MLNKLENILKQNIALLINREILCFRSVIAIPDLKIYVDIYTKADKQMHFKASFALQKALVKGYDYILLNEEGDLDSQFEGLVTLLKEKIQPATTVIAAKFTTIKVPKIKDIKEFRDKNLNSISDFVKGTKSKYIGAYLNEELLAYMSFTQYKEKTYISEYVCAKDTHVNGVIDELFKALLEKENPEEVYAELNEFHYSGAMLLHLGFDRISVKNTLDICTSTWKYTPKAKKEA